MFFIGLCFGLFLATCVPSLAVTVAIQRWVRVLSVSVVALLSLSMEPQLQTQVSQVAGIVALYFATGWVIIQQDRLYDAWKAFDHRLDTSA